MNETTNTASVELTAADTALLNEYLQAMDEIAQREPERLPAETWDKVWPHIQATGEVPAEYRDRIGVNDITVHSDIVDGKHRYIPEGKATKGYYDIVWERWNAERGQIESKYHDVIIKALRYALSNERATADTAPLMELLKSLIANDFMAAWDKVTQEKASPRSAAIEKGALMTIGGRIASYSTDDLKNALNAYSIYRLPASVDAKKAFDDTGRLNALMLQNKPLEGLTTMHTAFLMAVVQAVSLSQADDGSNTVSFYLPAICRELKIDPRTYSNKRSTGQDYAQQRFNAMIEIITPFDPFVGRMPDGSFYRVLTFESYDKGSETMNVSTPYLYRLKAIAAQRSTDLKRPQLNRLLHGAVVSEPNRAAVELASRILTGIVNRGVRADYKTYKAEPKVSKKTVTRTGSDGQRTTTTTVYDTGDQIDDAPAPSKIVTYKVKYSTLINDCPQLKRELDEITTGKGKAERDLEAQAAAEHRTASAEEIRQAREKDRKIIPQRINKKLKDIFTAAFRIIAEKSDAPARYIDFTLPTTTRTVKGKKCETYDVPTKSTLTRSMIITHRGRNPQYIE